MDKSLMEARILALYRFRAPILIRRLSQRMSDLALPVDWFWVAFAGVLLPILYGFFVIRFTPWGGLDLSMEYLYLWVPVCGGRILPVWQSLPMAETGYLPQTGP